MRLAWRRYAVFPAPPFAVRQFVALEDAARWMLALGVVLDVNRAAQEVTLLTPLTTAEEVVALRVGDVALEAGVLR